MATLAPFATSGDSDALKLFTSMGQRRNGTSHSCSASSRGRLAADTAALGRNELRESLPEREWRSVYGEV